MVSGWIAIERRKMTGHYIPVNPENWATFEATCSQSTLLKPEEKERRIT